VITLDELEDLGRRLLVDSPSVVADRIEAIRPDQLATLIYTSGTTGKPKGVRLTQDSWTYTAAAMDALGVLSDKDLNYLWLPLAHAFGKVMLALPLQIGFPTVVDGRVDKIIENLTVIRPTIMGAVPRIFEKVHGRINETMAKEGGVKKRLFDWATGVGDDECHIFGVRGRVHRGGCRTRRQDAEVNDHPLVPGAGRQCHPLFGVDAQRNQACGDQLDPVADLLPGDAGPPAVVGIPERLGVGCGRDAVEKHPGNRGRSPLDLADIQPFLGFVQACHDLSL
jgi:hypothetical protein